MWLDAKGAEVRRPTCGFRVELLRRLMAGVRGVWPVILGAREGLKRAIAEGVSGGDVAAVPGALHAEPVERGYLNTTIRT